MVASPRSLPVPLAVLLLLGCGADPVDPSDPPPPSGAPATLEIAAGNGETANPGTPVLPEVLVRDSAGRPVRGVKVGFTVESGGGRVAADTVATGDDGIASIEWTLGPLPATNRLRAEVAAIPPVHVSATGAYPFPVTIVAGTVALPAGARLDLGALSVETAIAAVPVAGAGTFSLPTMTGKGEQLAALHTAQGTPVLMGWVDAERRMLSARTTAELLTYVDVGGFTMPTPALRDAVRSEIGRRNLDETVAAIEAMLHGDPAGMRLDAPAIVAARRVVAERLRDEFEMPRGIIIEPAGVEQSGTVVDQVGFNSITITNHRRRRVAAFVDRVSYVPKGLSGSQNSPLAGPVIDLAAVGGATSIPTVAVDLLFGNYAWEPVVSAPQAVPLAPADAVSTRYQVIVVGPGTRNTGVSLTAEQRAAQERVSRETFVFEFLLPLIEQAFAADGAMQSFGKATDGELAALAGEIYELIPFNAMESIVKGDLKGALTNLWKTILDSGPAQEAFFHAIISRLSPQGVPPGMIAGRVDKWMKAFAVIEGVATAADLLAVVTHSATAYDAERWEVVVAEAEVRLNPPTSIISHGELLVMQATVLEATGGGPAPVFHYRWSTTGQHGQICAQFAGCSTSIPSSSRDVISYSPDLNTEGTDEVRVVVFVVEGGQEHIIGEATATVTTFAPQLLLTPAQSTIDYNERVDFTATIDPRLHDVGVVTYHWSTGGALGTFTTGGTTLNGSSNTATYAATAQVEGTEQVTVTARATKNGATRTIGTATATIVVEHEQPTTIQGRWEVSEVTPLDAGRQCVTAYIAFPLVPEARSYSVRAHGFNDTAFWGTQIQFGVTPPTQSYLPCSLGTGWGQSGETGGEYRFFLTGFAGPASSVGNAIGSFNSRFAGMVVDVTVHY